MNQNNAAQPVLTDEEIRAVWVEHGLDDEAVEDFARAIESALLSKLRAPVAAPTWGDDYKHDVRMFQRKAAAAPVADERQALAHVANEWADMACNAMVWIRNIQDGISTPKEALVSLMSNLTHCQEVQSCAGVRPSRENAPVAGERAAELMEEARSEGHSSVAAYVDQLKTSAATYREERNSARDAVARYRGESIARAALASSPVAIPAGWRLVPIAPTPEMESAGCDVPFGQDDVPAPATVYAAMLNAAPAVSAPVAGEAVYTISVKGVFHNWTPTTAAFSIPDGEHQLFLRPAAPQASEAVRDVEDAERWRWATASDGNADKLCSIVLCHGGYQDKINERADFYRAALSAQPGAQRTGGSE